VTAVDWSAVEGAEVYHVRLPGAVVLSSRQAVLDVLRALEAAERGARAQGFALPPRVQRLERDLARTLGELAAGDVTATGHADARCAESSPSWVASELVDTATAAAVLGVTERTVRRMAQAGQVAARKRGGTWDIDRADAERLARERSRTA
jgi:excisionase family DNA binding protein